MSILVVSWDRLGARMAGSAARAFEMAAALARRGEDVVLGAPDGSELPREVAGLRLAPLAGGGALGTLVDACSAVVLPGRMELVSAPKKPCIVDLYDPFVLSNLDLYGDDFARAGAGSSTTSSTATSFCARASRSARSGSACSPPPGG